MLLACASAAVRSRPLCRRTLSAICSPIVMTDRMMNVTATAIRGSDVVAAIVERLSRETRDESGYGAVGAVVAASKVSVSEAGVKPVIVRAWYLLPPSRKMTMRPVQWSVSA